MATLLNLLALKSKSSNRDSSILLLLLNPLAMLSSCNFEVNKRFCLYYTEFREEVVAQLVERLLLTPEICGSNLDDRKILSTNRIIEKTKMKKKRPEMANLFLKSILHRICICSESKRVLIFSLSTLIPNKF